MKTDQKINKTSFHWIFGMLAIIGLGATLTACATLAPKTSPAQQVLNHQTSQTAQTGNLQTSQTPTLVPTATNTPSPTSTATITPTSTETPSPLSAQAQAFDVKATNFRINDDKLDVDICIKIPDTQDWMIDQVTLQTGDLQIPYNSGGLIDYQPAGEDGTPGHRCDTYSFPLPLGLKISHAIVAVQSIAAQPREGQTCTFLLGTVQKILDERQSGIKIECTEQRGYADAHVVSKPDSLSQAEAEAIAFSREYYTVKGPWTFTTNDVPTATPYPTVSLANGKSSPYAVFQTLSQNADSGLTYPGWAYTHEDWQHDMDAEAYQTLPDGTAIPKAYQRETWYQLDETGRVIQSISQTRTNDGKLLLTEIFTKGESWTSATPERYRQQPYKLHLNQLYLGSLLANLKEGYASFGQTELDGLPAIIFTLKEDFQIPDQQYYNQPINSDMVTALFDMENGQLKIVQTVANLADGSQRKLEHMRLMIISGIEPPPQVLDLLAQTTAP